MKSILAGLLISLSALAGPVDYDVFGFFNDPFYAADHRSIGESNTKKMAEANMVAQAKTKCAELGGVFVGINNSNPIKNINASRYSYSYEGNARCEVGPSLPAENQYPPTAPVAAPTDPNTAK